MSLSKMLILENIQVGVLASIFGIERMYGFDLPNVNNTNKRTVYDTMHRMVKKGYIDNGEKELRVSSKIADIFNVIKEAETVLVIRSKGNERPSLCCYFYQTKVVVMQVSWADENAFRLTLMDSSDIFGFLDDNEYIPQSLLREEFVNNLTMNILTGDDEQRVVHRLEYNICEEEETDYINELLKLDNMCDVFTIINPHDGNVTKRVCTLRNGIKYLLAIRDSNVRVELFDVERLRKVLKI